MMPIQIRNSRYAAKLSRAFFIGAFLLNLFITPLFAARLDSELKDLEKAEKMGRRVAPEAIIRPIVEYKAKEFRSPFFSPFHIKVEPQAAQEKAAQAIEQEKPLPALKVQGIIWGGIFPQAIINDKVVKIGDTIEGVRILSVDKEGIAVFFEERKYSLPSPAAGAITSTSTKEPGG